MLAGRSRWTLLAGLVLAVVVLVAGVSGVVAAERYALAAEERYVAERLENASCLADWGINEGAADRGVSATDLTARGVEVTVRVPYAYRVETEEGPLYADLASEAVYEVGPTGPRRVEGDDVSPC